MRLELARIPAEGVHPDGREIAYEVTRALDEVVTMAQERPTIWRRLADGWTGARFEAALAWLHRAREGLLLIQPESAVLGRIPDLRAGVKARLPVTDPRFDGFMRLLDDLERGATEPPPKAPSLARRLRSARRRN